MAITPTIVGPQLPEQLELIIRDFDTAEKLSKTTGMLLWISANPNYVTAINKVLKAIEVILDNGSLNPLEARVRNLFLARAWMVTEEVKNTNEANKVLGFDNGQLLVLQDKLKENGASEEYYNLIEFIAGIGPIALSDGETRFGYFKLYEEGVIHTSVNGILQRINGRWKLVPANTSNINQNDVTNDLRGIVSSLRNSEELFKKLTFDELLLGQVLIGQLMTNYTTNMDIAPTASHPVFNQLFEMHKLFVSHLKKREGESLTINPRIIENSFRRLTAFLQDKRFNGLYSDESKISLLLQADQTIKEFVTFKTLPGCMASNSKLIVLEEETGESGVKVNVYLRNTPTGNELVIFFDGLNSFWEQKKFNATSFEGARAAGHLPGLGHTIPVSCSEKAIALINDILQRKSTQIQKPSRFYFVGGGLDGCVAQLVGYHFKKVRQEKDVFVVGCGVPPYLNQEAAATIANLMSNEKGFHCLNYMMSQDPNKKDLGIAAFLGMKYDGGSFMNIPVPLENLFAMESFKGEVLKEYMARVGVAQEKHLGLWEVNKEAQLIKNKLIQQTKALPQAEGVKLLSSKD